jgi:hypothetical protein
MVVVVRLLIRPPSLTYYDVGLRFEAYCWILKGAYLAPQAGLAYFERLASAADQRGTDACNCLVNAIRGVRRTIGDILLANHNAIVFGKQGHGGVPPSTKIQWTIMCMHAGFVIDLGTRKIDQAILANILRKRSWRLSAVQVKLLSATWLFSVEFNSLFRLWVLYHI